MDLRAAKQRGGGPLNIVLFRHYRDDDVTSANVEQLLLALGAAREPLAFEVFGIGPSGQGGSTPPRIETRFVAGRTDLPLVKAQLHNLYPRSAVESHQMGFHESDHQFKCSLLGGPNGGERLLSWQLFPSFPLVPTLRVGTHVWDALRPVLPGAATQSVAHWRSHAERGNEGEKNPPTLQTLTLPMVAIPFSLAPAAWKRPTVFRSARSGKRTPIP